MNMLKNFTNNNMVGASSVSLKGDRGANVPVKKIKNKKKPFYKSLDYLDNPRVNIYLGSDFYESDLDKLLDFGCGAFLKEKFENRGCGNY